MFKVIDDFLPEDKFNYLQSYLISNNFPWFFQSNITDPTEYNINLDEYGFSHVFYDNMQINSYLFYLCEDLLYEMSKHVGNIVLLKARADLTLYNPANKIHKPHTDLYEDHFVGIYYITRSSAPTLIYNETINFESISENKKKKNLTIYKKIYPEQNKMVIFNGNHLHTGYSPSNEQFRTLLNINFTHDFK